MIRAGGEGRLQCSQYWHRKIWDSHILSLSWSRLAVSPIVGYYCTMKGRFFPAQKGQKSSLARLYPFTRHSTGSRSSASVTSRGFPPSRLSQVICKNG